jgi:hypothetical protein
MSYLPPQSAGFVLGLVASITTAVPGFAQTAKPLKVFMTTDMEGVDGVFDLDLQCDPWKSPRWEESHKLLTGEVNAAVKGLYEGGATEVAVYLIDGRAHSQDGAVKMIRISRRLSLLESPKEPGRPTKGHWEKIIPGNY